MLTESIRELRVLLLVVGLAALQGCGTLYLAQAARGQWGVMHARRRIDSVVADSHTTDTLRARLVEVEAARDFAVTDLHLPDNRSYRTYADVKRPYVVWNVVAAREFSIEPKRWCFPIAGCVDYRGYFSEKRARAFAAKLTREGYDVTVGGVPAYSTLGKLADPVLSTMLRYGDNELAGMIFHELAHQLVYVKDDSEFNEAFATTVESVGLERWLKHLGHPDQIEEFRTENAEERAFIDLFARGRARLARLYASGVPAAEMRIRKRAAFAEIADQVRALDHRFGVDEYASWLAEGLNNAHLASVATYYECVPGFEHLLAEQHGDLTAFYSAVRELARLSRATRHAELCRASPSGEATRLTQWDQDDGVAAADFEHQHS